MEINRHQYLNVHFIRALKERLSLFILLTVVISFNTAMANTDDNQLNKTKVEYYQKDNITNQVPYFDNRFRLDAELEEVTLIFYRKSGSVPIILVRPDGSKVRVNNFDPDKVQWFDDSTFDMIKIKSPMRGPWQAIGDILPGSQILVVSDVRIAVEPLPEIVFSGETLKVEGRLFNGADAIKAPHFKDVVNLDVNFYSTNNTVYENFGADAIKLTSFRDDGYDLDEYANDNIFTGEFILDFAPGEWQPIYLVKLPMATRELKQTPLIVQKTPVNISVVKSEEPDKPHELNLSIDPTYVDPNSLLFQGKFTFPDRQTEAFSIMEGMGETRTTLITNTESGIYRVNISAFGKTTTGREFRLVVPEFSFNIESDEEIIDINTGVNADGHSISNESAEDARKKLEEEKIAAALLAHQKMQEEEEQKTLNLIVTGNLIIILIGAGVFFIIRRKKSNSHSSKSK